MQEVYRVIARVVSNDLTVLISGESGTGAEAAAGPYAVEAAQLEPLFGTATATRGDQGWTVKVPAGESVVWRVR